MKKKRKEIKEGKSLVVIVFAERRVAAVVPKRDWRLRNLSDESSLPCRL